MSTTAPVHVDRPGARDLRLVLLIALAALIARVLAALLLPDQTVHLPDAKSYRDMALQLWATGRTSHIYAMPLYPLSSC